MKINIINVKIKIIGKIRIVAKIME